METQSAEILVPLLYEGSADRFAGLVAVRRLLALGCDIVWVVSRHGQEKRLRCDVFSGQRYARAMGFDGQRAERRRA
ncbi:MAG: hypothetical protein H5T86_15550 [Armatimonadetes bacterium]|nr:hypothetical protein [Armatimonadota bacterium]